MKKLITIFIILIFQSIVCIAQDEMPNKCDCKLFFTNLGKPEMFEAAKKVLNGKLVETADKSFKNTRKAEKLCTEVAKNEMIANHFNGIQFSDVLQYYSQYDCDLKDTYSFTYFQLGFWLVFQLIIIFFVKYPYKLLLGLIISIGGLFLFSNFYNIKMLLSLSNFIAFMYILTFPIILGTSRGAWAYSLENGNINRGIKLGFGVCPNCYKKISRLANKCPYCTSDLN